MMRKTKKIIMAVALISLFVVVVSAGLMTYFAKQEAVIKVTHQAIEIDEQPYNKIIVDNIDAIPGNSVKVSHKMVVWCDDSQNITIVTTNKTGITVTYFLDGVQITEQPVLLKTGSYEITLSYKLDVHLTLAEYKVYTTFTIV